jgi:hypothetical protein
MNTRLVLSAALLLACVPTLHAEEGVADLPIGTPAPDFALPGIDGKTHKLHRIQRRQAAHDLLHL